MERDLILEEIYRAEQNETLALYLRNVQVTLSTFYNDYSLSDNDTAFSFFNEKALRGEEFSDDEILQLAEAITVNLKNY